jgi:DNA-binding transcriptional LysR family regulator
MREVNLAGLDLNLLPALEALLRRRNVTRAASDVGLSQPAMSRALARLRAALGDPLLVRVAGGLAPTPRALALAPRLSAVLDGLGGVFREPSLEPASMRRTFRLAAGDAQTVLLGPGILGRLRREAHGVDLRFEPLGPDLHARIESGALDFVFAVATTPLPPGATSEAIARDRLALVMRRGHPAAARRWTLDDYAEFAHVTVALLGDGQSEIDARLAEAGIARRIAFTSPHFMAALACVGATDCVTTISAALARRFADTFGLVLVEPPFVDPSLMLTLVGSALRSHDPALGWLRAHIRAAARDAYEPGMAAGPRP